MPNKSDSYSPLLVEIQLEQPVGEHTVVIRADQYLRSLTVDSGTEKAFTASLVLFDPSGDFIENKLLKTPIENRVIHLKWDWDRGRLLGDAPVYAAKVLQWGATFNEQGAELSIELMAVALEDALLAKVAVSYPKGTKVIEIIDDLIRTYGWSVETRAGVPSVDAPLTVTTKPSVQADGSVKQEPVSVQDAVLEKPFHSGYNDSIFQSVRDQLLPYAKDRAENPFLFYLDRDAVHFHSRTYLPDMAKNFGSPPIAASFVYARDMGGDVISFSPENSVIFSYLGGGENAEYVYYDESTKQDVVFATTKDGAKDILPPSTVPGEKANQGSGKGVKARIRLPARDRGTAIALASAAYSRQRLQAYKATLEVRGTHAADVGDFIDVKYYLPGQNVPHYLSGVFFVAGVQHSVAAGEWKTTFQLTRQGVEFTVEQPKSDEIKSPNVKAYTDKGQASVDRFNAREARLNEGATSKEVKD